MSIGFFRFPRYCILELENQKIKNRGWIYLPYHSNIVQSNIKSLSSIHLSPLIYVIVCNIEALRHIIVTGSNKGIGYAIVSRLASMGGWNVIMAVRNPTLGESTLANIKEKYPQASVSLQKLDISDSKSIDEFVQKMKEKYGKVDVLVNNAGVQVPGATLREDLGEFNSEVVEWTLKTNFYGTMEITEKMLPVLKDGGKVVTVGSYTGRVAYVWLTNERLKKQFSKPNLTKEELVALMREFECDVKEEQWKERGWPRWAYGVSKMGINIYNRVIGDWQQVIKRGIQVYSCCVGYVKTDMTSHDDRAVPLQEGIDTPMHLILLPFQLNKEIQGGFFQDKMLSSCFGNVNNLPRLIN